jgi:hypothetical protein
VDVITYDDVLTGQEMQPGQPEWWLRRLHQRLLTRHQPLQHVRDYYRGDQPLQFADEKYLEAFNRLLRASATNFCQLVVQATAERLLIDGFRAGGNLDADTDAWAIWQRNRMDSLSQEVHREALETGESYCVVWWDDDGQPLIMPETPEHTIVIMDRRRHQRLAGLRLGVDEYDMLLAELYLPNQLFVWHSWKPVDPGDFIDTSRFAWMTPEVRLNPLGVVPVIPFTNDGRFDRPAERSVEASELTVVMPLQDQINKLSSDMLVAAEYAAMPQRYATGLVLDRDEQGQPIHPFRAGLKLWIADNPQAAFGQFAAADLGNYTRAIDERVSRLAVITRTPPHYLSPSADRLSGESLRASESGLVAKVGERQRIFGEAWEDVMRLCGVIAGNDTLAAAADSEVVWRDPQAMVQVGSQASDAAVKRADLGVPVRQLWSDLGYSPQQIARFPLMNAGAQAEEVPPPPAAPPQALPGPSASP